MAPDAAASLLQSIIDTPRASARCRRLLGPLAHARATPKCFPPPSSPPSARAVALGDADEAQTSVPADALCRSPEPARPGGSSRQSAEQPRRQPARVTRSSTASSTIEDRQRRCLLLLPTLLRLLRRVCLAFSLLRHCCPPSLSGWRYRCSAVANRPALTSEIHKRKKINSRSA